jgi:CSLREA domain-containing protein
MVMRRSRIRNWRTATLAGLAAAALSLAGTASAATIQVTTTAEDLAANDPGCSLREAIIAANRDAPQGGCPAGDAGAQNTIVLAPGATYTLTAPDPAELADSDRGAWFGPNALPPIASSILIEGNGATIARSPSATQAFRLFFIGANPNNSNTKGYISPGPGALTLQDVTLAGGLAHGGDSNRGGGGAGMGGAIFNQGRLIIERSTLTGNTAEGGASATTTAGDGGGGIGTAADQDHGGSFGARGWNLGSGGSGGSGANGNGGGGGAGFATGEDGGSGQYRVALGGGPHTGLGGAGGGAGGENGGDGSGGGGAGNDGFSGGSFGTGGVGAPDGGYSGGGGGVGGGGGAGGAASSAAAGGGGFGGGGGAGSGSGDLSGSDGGSGGFGGGGGAGYDGSPHGSPGFGGGTPSGNQGGGGAGMGGAIFNMQGSVTIENSTFVSNSAIGGGPTTIPDPGKGIGGAVFNLNGTVTINSSTISGNAADYYGSQIYNLDYSDQQFNAVTTLHDTIVANGGGATNDIASDQSTYLVTAPSGSSAVVHTGQSDIVTTSVYDQENGQSDGVPLSGDPKLGALGFHGGPGMETVAPTAGSPALASGSGCPAVDERGVARLSGECDIGAVQPAAPTIEITQPADGARVTEGMPIKASYTCTADPATTISSCAGSVASGGQVDTTTAGAHSFTVNATDLLGRTSARINHYTVTAPPVISHASFKPPSFVAAKGTRLLLTLSEPATLRVAITHEIPGRIAGGRCSPSATTGARCTAARPDGNLSFSGTAGANAFAFRLVRLVPGTYTATLVAVSVPGARSKPVTVRFWIVRG